MFSIPPASFNSSIGSGFWIPTMIIFIPLFCSSWILLRVEATCPMSCFPFVKSTSTYHENKRKTGVITVRPNTEITKTANDSFTCENIVCLLRGLNQCDVTAVHGSVSLPLFKVLFTWRWGTPGRWGNPSHKEWGDRKRAWSQAGNKGAVGSFIYYFISN